MANKHENVVDQEAANKQRSLDELFVEQKLKQAALAKFEYQRRLDIQQEEKAEYYLELERQAQPVWDKFYELVDDFLHRSVAGYDSLQSVMSSMFQFCQKRGDALRAQAPIALGKFFDFIRGDNVVGYIASEYLMPIGSGVAHYLNDSVFGHAVKLDCWIDFVSDKDEAGNVLETGYVGIQNLVRQDGEKLTQEQVMAFEAEVVAWLSLKGYTPVDRNDPSRFQDADGRALTAQKFEELRPDFEKYLSKGNEVKAKLRASEESESPSPLRPR